MNNGWFEPQDQLIRNAHLLKGIPGEIAQGRYDVVTPMFTAWELAKGWPDAELTIVPDAGHTATEPGIVDVMVRASDRFAKG
jgi:proline iminopeptidase